MPYYNFYHPQDGHGMRKALLQLTPRTGVPMHDTSTVVPATVPRQVHLSFSKSFAFKSLTVALLT